MTREERIKLSVEEFSRLQKWMLSTNRESETYHLMYGRYEELKGILAALNVNLIGLDKIEHRTETYT